MQTGKIRTPLAALTLIVVFVLPVVALAQRIPEPTAPIGGTAITLYDVVQIVKRIMNYGVILATLAVVAMIVYAGFKMAMSRGQETEFKKGKDILKYAIYGALVVFGVGLIVNTIADVAYDPGNILY